MSTRPYWAEFYIDIPTSTGFYESELMYLQLKQAQPMTLKRPQQAGK